MLRMLKAKMCVPFLGAAASIGTVDQPGLPGGAQLAEELARDCDYPGKDSRDLMRVAQYFELFYDPHELRNSVCRALTRASVTPTPIHRRLATLPIPLVLTTNYDDLMERAFRDAQKEPQIAYYRARDDARDLDEPTVERPLVYKLHGSIEQPGTLVITEDDVIELLASLLLRDPDLPPLVKRAFVDRSILFIGYGLRDWNVRVMLRALRGRKINTPEEIAFFAIQRRPKRGLGAEWDRMVMYWEKRESLRCFNVDAFSFVDELAQRYHEQGPH